MTDKQFCNPLAILFICLFILILVALLCGCQGPQGGPGPRGEKGADGHTPIITIEMLENPDGIEFRFLADDEPLSRWLFVAHGRTDTVHVVHTHKDTVYKIIHHVDTLYIYTSDTIYIKQKQAWLEWQPNTEPDLAGYRVYWTLRENSGAFYCTTAEMLIDTLMAMFEFEVTAVDKSGNESKPSEVVKWQRE